MNEETEVTIGEVEETTRTKKKPTAKKPQPGKQKSKSGSVTAAKSKTAPGKKSAVKKAGSTSKKVGKSVKKAGSGKTSKKSSTTTKTSKESKKVGKSGQKPAPSASRSSADFASTTSKKAGTKVESSPSASGSKRTYTKRMPEGVDVTTLKPAKEYGISRIEQETKKNYGYYVRVGPPGSRSSIFFSDKKHGSRSRAFAAAREKRDELFETLPDWYKVRASRKRKVA